jgi:dihydrodipicolinate synthase/N-acetylneuraminate lyase
VDGALGRGGPPDALEADALPGAGGGVLIGPDAIARLRDGLPIPAHPLALTADGSLDELRQAALTRYYAEAGAGGIAVGVHSTQFAIRAAGLLEPVLRLASQAADDSGRELVKIAGASGATAQAVAEAELAATLGYHAVMPNIDGLTAWTDEQLLERSAAIARVLPIVGFYLQPAAGGRRLGPGYWRRLAELPGLVAIKIAPFDRYATLDVVRAVCASERRDEIALYTGNDDSIVVDLLTTYRVRVGDTEVAKPIVGCLLGQFAVWTKRSVELFERARRARAANRIDGGLLTLAARLTDANGALFDAANGFAGCIPGINEVLRRQGLIASGRCLDPGERLSPGQGAEIDRVLREHRELADDDFVRANRERWLAESGALLGCAAP